MHILVFSDSHRVGRPMLNILTLLAEQVQMVIHLGDYAGDLLALQPQFPNLPFHTVIGNSDGSVAGETESILTVEGARILLTHGHRQQVKSGYEQLIALARKEAVDFCLFGHTHTQALFQDGPIKFMNPGSISLPKVEASAGYGLLVINKASELRGMLVQCT